MSKHPYRVGCECKRCTRETGRRAAQSAKDFTARSPRAAVSRAQQRRQSALEKWATDYIETEGGIDQFNPEDR
jgi:hypothetical protein